ncbi:MAG: hypothetical protein E7172_03935 [Firmicutes bacterium]|nr:hypothetical protein [Bacillota bacterium]
MNVIVSNKYQSLLADLDIDVIKSINGEFNVDELVNLFANFYYNKMIIDLTAIRNYEDINVLRTLSLNFDPARLIILLNDSPKVNNAKYLSQLVSIGIYNFTKRTDNIAFLINNPNTYKDVVNFQDLEADFSEPALNDLVEVDDQVVFKDKRVIGFKNITDHAGATTLVYLLRSHLEVSYKVNAVEINCNDFVFFNDKKLDSCSSLDFAQYKNKHLDSEVILVDLNDGDEKLCDEIIYLIEPGLIKLNKLIRKDNRIFEKLKNKKIVLNRSVLDDKEVMDFEKESGSKVFFNISYVDDKLDNQEIINKFLIALGFSRIGESSNKGIFSIFK